jgi:hypothetical protein
MGIGSNSLRVQPLRRRLVEEKKDVLPICQLLLGNHDIAPVGRTDQPSCWMDFGVGPW